MAPKTVDSSQQAAETGAIVKNWRNRIRVALAYPNTYRVGMANLGLHTVYRLFNAMDHVVCERVFLPEGPGRPAAASEESGRPLTAFDIVAFSIAYENDYLNVLSLLSGAGLPLRSGDRTPSHPLVIAGGVACQLNPEPLAPFIDCFFIGEAEVLVPAFMALFDPALDRCDLLLALARGMAGAYVPAFYRPLYAAQERLSAIQVLADVPQRVQRVFVEDMNTAPATSAIVTPAAGFGETFLIEVSRGCPHGCRFCSAGYVGRPPRFRPPSLLGRHLEQAAAQAPSVGLVGAAVSDLPHVDTLCNRALEKGLAVSISSLRADALSPELAAALAAGKAKTATIAPDAGSERMRRVINKGFGEQEVITAVERLVTAGIANIRLYFMVGLAFETQADVRAIVDLSRRIKKSFLQASRSKGRIGTLSLSVSCFVPKPVTPLQWVAMERPAQLKQKLNLLRHALAAEPNLTVRADNPRQALVQALLARGSRRCALVLEQALAAGGNWTTVLKNPAVDLEALVFRTRDRDEAFAWEIIDHGVSRAYLWKEYRKASRAQTTDPCPTAGPCRRCGVVACAQRTEKDKVEV